MLATICCFNLKQSSVHLSNNYTFCVWSLSALRVRTREDKITGGSSLVCNAQRNPLDMILIHKYEFTGKTSTSPESLAFSASHEASTEQIHPSTTSFTSAAKLSI